MGPSSGEAEGDAKLNANLAQDWIDEKARYPGGTVHSELLAGDGKFAAELQSPGGHLMPPGSRRHEMYDASATPVELPADEVQEIQGSEAPTSMASSPAFSPVDGIGGSGIPRSPRSPINRSQGPSPLDSSSAPSPLRRGDSLRPGFPQRMNTMDSLTSHVSDDGSLPLSMGAPSLPSTPGPGSRRSMTRQSAMMSSAGPSRTNSEAGGASGSQMSPISPVGGSASGRGLGIGMGRRPSGPSTPGTQRSRRGVFTMADYVTSPSASEGGKDWRR